ncbi:hypothetical protein [Methylobacterium segetis]|uniref:hypothetical protein n=1 Tax=Methylobacterium segetis TaxID=2488750 RepID=UPI00104C130D|nr:hypothetical protein [Methylobacterium segetis]
MKALALGLIAASLVSVVGAEARPNGRSRIDAAQVLAPLEKAATDCFAETVMANPGAMNHARAGEWYKAAGVIGFLCRPEVDAMTAAHDQLYGPGSGARYFKGGYAKHLDRALAERLQPFLERKAVASAEPPVEHAAAGDAAEH